METLRAALAGLELDDLRGPAIVGLRVVAILLVAWIAVAILQGVIRAFRVRLQARMEDREQMKRAETLGRAFRYLVGVTVSVIAVILILSELGIAIAPILGAAGVVGIAVGFGAQSLVKDYFTGFFILLENQIRQGDVVEVGGKSGIVEEITLRYVQLRDYDGNVHFVPNSLITTVTNMTRGYAHAVIDVGVGYGQELEPVFETMRAVAAEMRGDAKFADAILEDVEIVGVEKWDASAIVARCRFKVAPIRQWEVKREFLKRLRNAFATRGIDIPYPHVTLANPGIEVRVSGEAGMRPPSNDAATEATENTKRAIGRAERPDA